jgi:hypothetical protein
MDLVDLINSRRFLGSEFLMWLWFKSECYDGMFDIPNHDRVEVVYDDRMTLEAYLAETERNMFRGGAPAYSPEARVALREGKRVQRAKLRVIKEGREWTFNIKAESLDLTSVKIPSLLSREEEEQFYERMYLVEELEEILDELFKEFLNVRLTYAWEEVMVPAMREWIASDDFMSPDDYPADEVLEGDLIQVESAE